MGRTGRLVVTRGSVEQLSMTRDDKERPREIEMGKPSHTEQLTRWITNVRQKKLKCHRSPKRDFRVEAVLTHALHKAECELRVKQLSRISRWRRLRKDLLKGVEYGSCGVYNATEREYERCDQRPVSNDLWRENMCEDLGSLMDFLRQLSGIKTTLQR
ncbi:hypothetical protein P5V15_009893 [Pogonomyrmex californicus]